MDDTLFYMGQPNFLVLDFTAPADDTTLDQTAQGEVVTPHAVNPGGSSANKPMVRLRLGYRGFCI
jgi:hypothetical protein